MIEKHRVTIPMQTRYFTQGEMTDQTRFIWLVFHGYGQLASFFIKKFEGLDKQHFVIAPEGAHRFYLAGTEGRVGASWMTKEDRETDISNQQVFIDTIIKPYQTHIDAGLKLIVLGFSQGTATAMRWLAKNPIDPHRLILWAGTIPPDLKKENSTRDWSSFSTQLVYGNQDPYLNTSYAKETRKWIAFYNLSISEHHFAGKHTIPSEVLRDVAANF